MFQSISILTVMLALIFTPTTFADIADEVVDITPRNIFVPQGFDDNDQIEVVSDGYLPDTCYRVRPTHVRVDVDKKRILVQPRAQVFPGVCMDVTVPFSTTVSLGFGIPAGNYEITTGKGEVKERLVVGEAQSIAPDDYLYAPVDTATIRTTTDGKQKAVLMGRFTSTCWVMDTTKITVTGKTLQVLPMMKELDKDPNGNQCKLQERPFEEIVELPALAKGRYLLHVRSLNGQSVNEVFNTK